MKYQFNRKRTIKIFILCICSVFFCSTTNCFSQPTDPKIKFDIEVLFATINAYINTINTTNETTIYTRIIEGSTVFNFSDRQIDSSENIEISKLLLEVIPTSNKNSTCNPNVDLREEPVWVSLNDYSICDKGINVKNGKFEVGVLGNLCYFGNSVRASLKLEFDENGTIFRVLEFKKSNVCPCTDKKIMFSGNIQQKNSPSTCISTPDGAIAISLDKILYGNNEAKSSMFIYDLGREDGTIKYLASNCPVVGKNTNHNMKDKTIILNNINSGNYDITFYGVNDAFVYSFNAIVEAKDLLDIAVDVTKNCCFNKVKIKAKTEGIEPYDYWINGNKCTREFKLNNGVYTFSISDENCIISEKRTFKSINKSEDTIDDEFEDKKSVVENIEIEQTSKRCFNYYPGGTFGNRTNCTLHSKPSFLGCGHINYTRLLFHTTVAAGSLSIIPYAINYSTYPNATSNTDAYKKHIRTDFYRNVIYGAGVATAYIWISDGFSSKHSTERVKLRGFGFVLALPVVALAVGIYGMSSAKKNPGIYLSLISCSTADISRLIFKLIKKRSFK